MNQHDESLVETVPPAVLLEINRLCVEFEQAWRDGKSPRVEDYAARISGDAQLAAIRELIAQEADLRWAAGQSAEAEEYHQRFPQYPQAVNGAFSLLKGRQRTALQLVETDSFVGVDGSETKDNPPLACPNSRETPAPQEPPFPEHLGRFRICQDIPEYIRISLGSKHPASKRKLVKRFFRHVIIHINRSSQALPCSFYPDRIFRGSPPGHPDLGSPNPEIINWYIII